MKLDSEWQIEPRLNRPSSGGSAAAYLPAVTVVYTGKLSALSSLEPTVSTAALERELSVRKMERDVDELERLRRQDQIRAKQERDRRKAVEAAPPPAPAPAPPAAWGRRQHHDRSKSGDAGRSHRPLPLPVPTQGLRRTSLPALTSGPERCPHEWLSDGKRCAVGTGANSRPVRKRKPANDEWRPFQTITVLISR